ncbi:MAG: SDR family oxidoreductase [bacterium]|nr:SDR family oxidoreductase [bacterium]MCX7917823.1 SDR family oxidoreductase [bacterium]MDW8163311.1 SDR family oxidoreductase [Candidatus Omnitrophota bacterium]
MKVKELFNLEGEKAIVTGSSQGLGKEMAIALAEAGADIAIVDINLEKGKEVVEEIKKIGRESFFIKCDVSKEKEVENMVKAVKNKFKKIDILVNNAGIVNNFPAEEMELKEWEKIMDVDLTGVFICSQKVGKIMIEQKKGVIVNIASMSGIIVNNPQPQCHYNTAKAGVIMLTKSLAAEWAKYNIRVNAIAPGYMATDMVKRAFPKYGKKWIPLIPMGRIGNPYEIKGPVVFLCSKASSYITGSVIVMDGGYTIW